ncbi:MAG: hypothetical protein U0935_10620 [Pirellulales bacterium]
MSELPAVESTPAVSAPAPSLGRLAVQAMLIVTGVLLVAFPVFAGYGYARYGAAGVGVAAVVGAVCWLGGMAGFAAILPFRGPQAVNGVLMGMLVRMMVPLAAGLVLFSQGGPLVRAGLVEMLVAYYLLALTLDTVLAVRMMQRISRPGTRA